MYIMFIVQIQFFAIDVSVKSSETEKLSRHAAKLDTVYGLYLQGMMEDLILEKIKKLHKKVLLLILKRY